MGVLLDANCTRDCLYLPKTGVHFNLSDKKRINERKAYTIFILFGDVGGFNSAVVLPIIFLMSQYNTRLYQSSLFGDVPIKTDKENKSHTPSPLEQ